MATRIVEFSIPGVPVAKGRARFAKIGNFIRTYTPAKTTSFENLVKLMYTQASGAEPHDGPVIMEINAYFPCSQKIVKIMKKNPATQIIPMLTRPDADNIAKAICDGLNGIAYTDDKLVCSLSIHKYYSTTPRTNVYMRFE